MKLPKLHLRDLFWLVLVCALVLGWVLDADRRKVASFKERQHNWEQFERLQRSLDEMENDALANGIAWDWDEAKERRVMRPVTAIKRRDTRTVRQP